MRYDPYLSLKGAGDQQPMLEPNKPLTLLLGNVDDSGTLSKLKAAGRQYQKKILDSSIENWKTILEYFDGFLVDEALIKLSAYTYKLIASEQYREIAEELFAKIAKIPNIVFVYESFLSGKDDSKEDQKENNYYYHFGLPDEDTRFFVNSLLERIGLNVIPYKRNAELTVLALTFLDQTEQNLFFRMYVPSGRMWALEADKLLQLFRDYLSKVSKVNIRLDQYRTDQGTIFEFHGNDENDQILGISDKFDEFSRFLDLCVSNPSAAEDLLKNDKDVDSKVIYAIVERYSKEAKRLVIDLKHERERRMLGVRHRLEAELTEIVPSDFNWQIINHLVDEAIPRINGVSSALGASLQLTSASSLTVNIQPQIINSVNSVVAQEIIGDQYLSEDAERLLNLIQKYGGEKTSELISAVHELADESAPQPGRLTARQKLKKFVLGLGSRIGDIAAGVLQAYIENQLGL
jgi:hypothetical protein